MSQAATANYRQTRILYMGNSCTVTDANTGELLGYLVATGRYQLTARNGNHQYVGTFEGPGMWAKGSQALASL